MTEKTRLYFDSVNENSTGYKFLAASSDSVADMAEDFVHLFVTFTDCFFSEANGPSTTVTGWHAWYDEVETMLGVLIEKASQLSEEADFAAGADTEATRRVIARAVLNASTIVENRCTEDEKEV